MAEVANAGIVRPPLVYLVAIAAGVTLGWLCPAAFVPAGLAVPLGVAIVAASVVLFFASVLGLRRAGTPIPGNRPTTAIVRAGPYRFSRNPIYLAFSLLQLGIAAWTDNAWLLVTLVGAIALMSVVVIPKEERYLEAGFGAEYRDYKARVRRWL